MKSVSFIHTGKCDPAGTKIQYDLTAWSSAFQLVTDHSTAKTAALSSPTNTQKSTSHHFRSHPDPVCTSLEAAHKRKGTQYTSVYNTSQYMGSQLSWSAVK